MPDAFENLKQYLFSLAPEVVADAELVEHLLSRAWDAFSVAGDPQGMTGDKLVGRMESIQWQPPVLVFTIDSIFNPQVRSILEKVCKLPQCLSG